MKPIAVPADLDTIWNPFVKGETSEAVGFLRVFCLGAGIVGVLLAFIGLMLLEEHKGTGIALIVGGLSSLPSALVLYVFCEIADDVRRTRGSTETAVAAAESRGIEAEANLRDIRILLSAKGGES